MINIAKEGRGKSGKKTHKEQKMKRKIREMSARSYENTRKEEDKISLRKEAEDKS